MNHLLSADFEQRQKKQRRAHGDAEDGTLRAPSIALSATADAGVATNGNDSGDHSRLDNADASSADGSGEQTATVASLRRALADADARHAELTRTLDELRNNSIDVGEHRATVALYRELLATAQRQVLQLSNARPNETTAATEDDHEDEQ